LDEANHVTLPLKQLSGHVGFDRLPDQVVNRSLRQGFQFNILLVGDTGIGKSTLVDSLFSTRFESARSSHSESTVSVNSSIYKLQENNVHLSCGIVETRGFGDQVDKTQSLDPIVDYIHQQFEDYLQEELRIKRNLPVYQDSRVHVCLYLIGPHGHGIKALDLVCLKQLVEIVNVIPVIAKADTVTRAELNSLKAQVRRELQTNGINIYQFPLDDETMAVANSENNGHLPFAIIGSNDFVKVGLRTVRARQYPWGVVEVENENHNDFCRLREMLVRSNMNDMCTTTHTRHYEMYRRKRLEELGLVQRREGKESSMIETVTLRRQKNFDFLKSKETEISQKYVKRVKEKEEELKKNEKDLKIKFDEEKQRLAAEMKSVEKEWKILEESIEAFQRLKEEFEMEKLACNNNNVGWKRKKRED